MTTRVEGLDGADGESAIGITSTSSTLSKGITRIPLTAIETSVGATPLSARDRFRGQLGLIFALIIVAMFILALSFVGLIALISKPSVAEFGVASPEGRQAYLDARQVWFSNVKDLLQLLVVALLVPMLSTLIGFLFARGNEGGS